MPNEAQNLANAILNAYGWTSIPQMQASDEYKKSRNDLLELARKRGGNPPLVADILQALSIKTEKNVSVPAWFVRHTIFTDYDDTTKQRVKTGEGSVVVLQDGTIKTIGNSQILDCPPMTRLIVGPVSVRHDLGKDTHDIIPIKDETKIIEQAHTAPTPDVPLTDSIARLMQPSKKRGVILGDSGNFQAFGILEISNDRDDIRYFGAGPNKKFKADRDELTVVARDSAGNAFSISLPVDEVRMYYGLDASDGVEQYRLALKGEPIAVNGKIDLFADFTPDRFKDREDVDNEVQKLMDGGHFVVVGKTPDKTPLHGLSLKRFSEQLPTGELVPLTRLSIGGKQIYDIKERTPGEWHLKALATEEGRPPKFDVMERPFVYKNGPNTGQPGKMNEGAYVIFLNRSATRVRASDDKFVQAALQLGFDLNAEG